MPADERPVDPEAPIDVMDDGEPGEPQPLGPLVAAVREREARSRNGSCAAASTPSARART